MTLKITVIAVYSALIFAVKMALAIIPNVELTTILIILAAVVFPFSMSLPITVIYVLLEGLMFGFNPEWYILYCVAWPLLLVISFSLRSAIKRFWWIAVIVASLFGYLFGTLDAVIKLYMFDFQTALAYWTKGILFDIIHGTSNFIITMFLFKPLLNLFTQHFNNKVYISNKSKLWSFIFRKDEYNISKIKKEEKNLNEKNVNVS